MWVATSNYTHHSSRRASPLHHLLLEQRPHGQVQASLLGLRPAHEATAVAALQGPVQARRVVLLSLRGQLTVQGRPHQLLLLRQLQLRGRRHPRRERGGLDTEGLGPTPEVVLVEAGVLRLLAAVQGKAVAAWE